MATRSSVSYTHLDVYKRQVYERGRALIPSWLAFSVTKLLETNFPKLVDYQFTAEMENGLDRIAHGEESGRDWLTHFYFGSGEGAARNADEAHEGLQQQVAQLGEIDARAINTIDIGDGLHVRVGRYGPYLELSLIHIWIGPARSGSYAQVRHGRAGSPRLLSERANRRQRADYRGPAVARLQRLCDLAGGAGAQCQRQLGGSGGECQRCCGHCGCGHARIRTRCV